MPISEWIKCNRKKRLSFLLAGRCGPYFQPRQIDFLQFLDALVLLSFLPDQIVVYVEVVLGAPIPAYFRPILEPIIPALSFFQVMRDEGLNRHIIRSYVCVIKPLVLDIKLRRRNILPKVVVSLHTLQGFSFILVYFVVDALVIIGEVLSLSSLSSLSVAVLCFIFVYDQVAQLLACM